jgi:toxin FitB
LTFLLDTNVVSETRRKRPDPQVIAWLGRVDPDTLHISVLTLGEIAKGVAQRAKREAVSAVAIQQWLDALRLRYAERIVGIDAEIAETWGRLSAARPIPVIDGLFSATALVRGMTLVTRNVRDIAGTGVGVINPWSP